MDHERRLDLHGIVRFRNLDTRHLVELSRLGFVLVEETYQGDDTLYAMQRRSLTRP